MFYCLLHMDTKVLTDQHNPTFIRCADTGCRREDSPRTMIDKDLSLEQESRESMLSPCFDDTTWHRVYDVYNVVAWSYILRRTTVHSLYEFHLLIKVKSNHEKVTEFLEYLYWYIKQVSIEKLKILQVHQIFLEPIHQSCI